jgi:colanic acid biosynthesis glycosyl transferase WcaI
MNLLIICPHFRPDVAPTGEVMTAIVRELAARGHRLQIVTSLPWYRHHRIDDGWSHRLVQTEETEWGWITRLHPFPTDKSNLPARAMAFGGFTALSAAVASVAKMRPDAVLAMSPPLILGGAGWLAARRWRVPFVFNIQDVFPDVAVEVGAITNPKVIAAASWIERFLYLRSDAVTVLSDDLRANLAAKLGARRPERVRVIPNFVDTAAITPADRITPYRAELGLGDRTVVMYAGNLGYSQSVGLLIEAARRFRDRDDLVFVINGSGSARAGLVEAADGLDNVVFAPMQPRERVSEVLATGDLHTVLLKTGLARSSVPSKMYSILAAGRPCLASVDLDTEVDRTLRDANAGRVAAPDDVDAFVATLGEMLDRRDDWAGWGRSGRHWVEEWLSPAAVAESYEQLFEELAGRRSGESSSLR